MVSPANDVDVAEELTVGIELKTNTGDLIGAKVCPSLQTGAGQLMLAKSPHVFDPKSSSQER